MGSRVETALALAVLYGLDGKNDCRVVSISSSRTSLLSAAYCEVVGRYYAGAVSGAFGSFASASLSFSFFLNADLSSQ